MLRSNPRWFPAALARPKEKPLPDLRSLAAVLKILVVLIATRAFLRVSQPPTRCLDAHDDRHDDVRLGGDVCY